MAIVPTPVPTPTMPASTPATYNNPYNSPLIDYNNGLRAIQNGRNAYSGPVLPGTNTQYFRATGQSIPTVSNTSSNGGGGGGNGGNPNNPPAPPDPTQQLIDSNYNDIMNYLNGLQGTAQSNYGSIKSGINSGIDTSRTNLAASNDAATQQLQQSTDQGNQRKQDALTAATRLYNELIQGGQQRFGGASSAGEAYQALTGRELQRNQQQTQTDYSTFMGQIATAKNNLQVQYQNGLRSLEQQRNDALAQAERDYQNQLSQIQSSKLGAQQDKANAQLSALQQLRNNVYQINVANAQNSGALQSALTQAQQQLDQYTSTLHSNLGNVQQGQQAYNANTNLNPQTSLTMGGNTGGNAFTPTGAINPHINPNTGVWDDNWFAQHQFGQ